MDSSQEFKPLRDAVQSTLVAITRSVNTLANEDLQFQRTVHRSVATRLDQNTNRLLQLATSVLKSAGEFTAQRRPKLEDVDDVEIQWKGIVDVIDSLLEKSDTCLDEYTGLIKRKDAPTAESGRDAKRPKSTTERLDWSLKRANILKPQNAFEKKIDNFESGPWKPLLTHKPHSQIPLEASLTTFTDEEGHVQYKHPYEHEITNMQYPAEVYQSCEPKEYLPIEKTKAIWVDTYEGVLEMLEELKKASEIAIDLEHHDYRSYTGLLSLMQISTREKDWIVDTLVPWRHKLEVLNEVFADPKIVKVLHGAFMDIIWLQRDLGLYVVGLFDTYYACTALGYAGRSLAFLLKKFADFDADKRYQLADWRIRPLPDEMFYYARSDTHYLLYIYDMLRNELVELSTQTSADENPTELVIQKSKEVSLQRHEHPLCDPETGAGNRGWFNTLIKSPTLYNGEQFAVYKAVHKWRDDVARREDESPYFIMTQQVLADIARILPTDMKALWSLLDSNARVLKPHLNELFDVIREARARGANGPTMMQFFSQSSGNAAQTSLGTKEVKADGAADGILLALQELKSEHSQLWGGVALSTTRDGSVKALAMDEQVEIPVFTFDFGTIKDEEPPKATAPSPECAPEEDAVAPGAQEDEGFTLKAGRKRKASEVDIEVASDAGSDLDIIEGDQSPPADQPDSTDVEDEDAKALKRARKKANKTLKNEAKKLLREAKEKMKQGSLEAAEELKRQAKQARKAAKKAAKLVQQQGSPVESPSAAEEAAEEASAEQDEQPFDYSKASSVLHAPKANENGDSGKRGKAAFDPYARKSGNAPQGARKLNYERTGRTATFKK
ncbi:ribonuclease H-like domain-containing protein [Chaetomium strumarium]|uniref:Ribonuclease H-like domain-containing protein n=1 Tax=Chaetomium strumarium TaxID=1170767 RepID=A0AAJ0GTF3_9PEZI|nr:ribonuclease H-like domain-containing protein [Chaetomium strumarium]